MFHRNTNKDSFWGYKVKIQWVQALEYKYSDDAVCENMAVKWKVSNYYEEKIKRGSY